MTLTTVPPATRERMSSVPCIMHQCGPLPHAWQSHAVISTGRGRSGQNRTATLVVTAELAAVLQIDAEDPAGAVFSHQMLRSATLRQSPLSVERRRQKPLRVIQRELAAETSR